MITHMKDNGLSLTFSRTLTLDINLKLEVSRMTKAAFDQARQKLESDWSVIEDLPIGDDIKMVWNNRRIESTFGYLKSIDRKSF